ncbi:hypothetical protein [Pontibacter mangrovi]|uniref:Outer membrane protein beta-barrel domain-containing protein n=1 Tax=Pontibacter mangrovi TaxID=2589816 RepID=A0A501VYD5_9BACT|nr:hypothetical protein [Pontibacter mangrovi]TPE42753.1 hypothetical protein FJM65_16980 [Pontibacter mangrovi]
MKTLFLSLMLLTSFAAKAQLVVYKDTARAKQLYIGANALVIGYDLKYSQQPKGGNIQPYASMYMGYKLNKRVRLQTGIWYGTDNQDWSYTYVESEDNLIHYNETSKTRGVGVPITMEYMLFYPLKRLQFYGTGMFTPMYSTTQAAKTEQEGGIETVIYNEKTSGLNAYLTGGFGLGYNINSRLDAYFNYYMISRSFRRKLAPRDEYPYPGSLAIGLNYNLNLKREK